MKLKKCEFFKDSVTFLGHTITSHGIEIDAKKLASVKDWPIPSSIKEI